MSQDVAARFISEGNLFVAERGIYGPVWSIQFLVWWPAHLS